MNLADKILKNCQKPISDCSDEEVFIGLVKTINEICHANEKMKTKKKLYYVCAEFLLGKLLGSNLINLGIYDEVKKILSQNGKDLNKIEEIENEPSLGNGGLGRLAACFLDSVAAIGLNGDGIGLNYHYGLFRQVFKNNFQIEKPNEWINESGFLNKTDISYDVKFKDFNVKSRLYDIDIVSNQNSSNTLHLFDIETIDESIVGDGIEFDKTDIKKNLTLFLYPDDSDENGRLLRIYQQYFMVSNAAQLIIDECTKRGSNLYDLYDYAVIQINDTHPSLIIPELIRLLIKKDIPINDAIEIVTKTCAYTNHTILAEALEKWPMDYLLKIVPSLVPIIEILDNKVRRKYDDKSVYIIDKDERVHMAHMDIHYTFSTNGVAKLHTEILKNTELNNFNRIYPQKFNN
ncbi:MAG: glycogen/starch/alpha-glucan phosphorylase, partial [Clostridia bacterium]|nr:glycogen/starch/alpha-glucan phosphorylase [Clostridia bacterium]